MEISYLMRLNAASQLSHGWFHVSFVVVKSGRATDCSRVPSAFFYLSSLRHRFTLIFHRPSEVCNSANQATDISSMFNLLHPSGLLTYHQGLTLKNCTWCSLCVERFVRISEQTAVFALYTINWLVFITVVESVYSAVQTGCLYKADCVSSVKG
jgi:hypothetical protein